MCSSCTGSAMNKTARKTSTSGSARRLCSSVDTTHLPGNGKSAPVRYRFVSSNPVRSQIAYMAFAYAKEFLGRTPRRKNDAAWTLETDLDRAQGIPPGASRGIRDDRDPRFGVYRS